jgi:hypothetical protein
MAKFFFSLITVFFVSNVFASTSAHFTFTGEQVIITMSSQSFLGQQDFGPERLFKDLNQPIEKSFIGDGKVLKDSQGEMTFIVADRGSQRYEVSIVLKRGTNIKIDAARKQAEVLFTGTTAQYLYSKWPVTNNKYEFTNQDGNLILTAEPNKFKLTFQ